MVNSQSMVRLVKLVGIDNDRPKHIVSHINVLFGDSIFLIVYLNRIFTQNRVLLKKKN